MKGFKYFSLCIVSMLLLVSQLSIAQETYLDPALIDSEVLIETEIVNINQADAETIALVLNGVGISRAEAIVSYRDNNGVFSSLNDLIQVKGIGEVTILRNESRINFD